MSSYNPEATPTKRDEIPNDGILGRLYKLEELVDVAMQRLGFEKEELAPKDSSRLSTDRIHSKISDIENKLVSIISELSKL